MSQGAWVCFLRCGSCSTDVCTSCCFPCQCGVPPEKTGSVYITRQLPPREILSQRLLTPEVQRILGDHSAVMLQKGNVWQPPRPVSETRIRRYRQDHPSGGSLKVAEFFRTCCCTEVSSQILYERSHESHVPPSHLLPLTRYGKQRKLPS